MQNDPHGPLHEAAMKQSERNWNTDHAAVKDADGLVVTGTTFNETAALRKAVSMGDGHSVAVYCDGAVIYLYTAEDCQEELAAIEKAKAA